VFNVILLFYLGLKLLLTAIVFLHSGSTVQKVKASDLHKEENDVFHVLLSSKHGTKGKNQKVLEVIIEDNPH